MKRHHLHSPHHLLLLALLVSVLLVSIEGASIGFINKEVAYPPSAVSSENDADVEELHSLNSPTRKQPSSPIAVVLNKESANQLKPLESEETKRSQHHELPSSSSNDVFSSRDTPRDMAEYIFWTGDENGVISAIKDFVDQGLISEEEGREFLNEVQYDLQEIRLRYEPEMNPVAKPIKQDANSGPKTHQGEIVVTSYRDTNNKSVDGHPPAQPLKQDEDRLEEEIKSGAVAESQEAMAQELQLAELLSNEYSLEEIIYQLARILFSQSLSQAGHPEAEKALKKFADFLEKESKEGRLSLQMQKKVLDVLLMSLFDALGPVEHGSQAISPSAEKRTLPELANEKGVKP